ncbi:Transcriptional regulatory protein CpxR [Thalassocella blandensis]|nr:Transcriptional regulatory protein CpxR [Thalassocella blandensis]
MTHDPTPIKRPHVLLVDDDRELCELLQEFLSSEDFVVSSVNDGQSAIERISQDADNIDVVVLDIMMPQVSGLDVLRDVRKSKQADFIPIIMLTGKGDDIDRIVGLEMGADDYLGKPCNPRELSARIRAVLRRTQQLKAGHPGEPSVTPEKDDSISLFGVRLTPANLSVEITAKQKNLELTGVEFRVLYLLMQNAGSILSKAELTEKVLQRKLTAHDRSIDVHISRIRQKLASEAGIEDVIKAVRGAGYLFVEEHKHDG